MQNQKFGKRLNLVPALVNGHTIMIDANSIPAEAREKNSGPTVKGDDVAQSAYTYEIGDSTLIWPSNGAPASSIKTIDLRVLARRTLEKHDGVNFTKKS